MQKYHTNSTTNLRMRVEIKNSKLSYRQIASKYNISVGTVHRWKNRDNFIDRSCRPKKLAYVLTDNQVDYIKSLRLQNKTLDEIYIEVKSLFSCCKQTIYNYLKKLNLNRIRYIGCVHKIEPKEFKTNDIGYIHIDITRLPKINKDKNKYLFIAIDRVSRLPYYKLYSTKEQINSIEFFNKVIEYYPFTIKKILTDNGLEFNKAFTNILKEHNIKHIKTKPYTPQTNGMIERFNRTIKDKTVKITQYANKQHMCEHLNSFFRYYNINKYHSSLNKEINIDTPIDALRYYYNHTNYKQHFKDDFNIKNFIIKILNFRVDE